MTNKQINLGLLLYGPGAHMNSWKAPDVPADGSINLDHYVNITKKAEDAGFAFAFIADGLYIDEKSIPHFQNRFEPLTLLSALAMVTSKIGLVGTVSTTYSEPFNIARQFASLDKLSSGRAGWNVVTSPLEGSAENFNRGNHPEHALRYEMAAEYVDVVQGLWDSWEDDAFVRDRETGKFSDFSKMHRLNHKGKFFKAQGPLNIERSEQGQPVIFQAGASKTGMKFAAKYGEAIFTVSGPIEKAKAQYRELKQAAVEKGRRAEDLLIFPSLSPIIGPTEAAAEQKYEEIKNLLSVEEALTFLSRYFDHYDFSGFPLDEPFPELGDVGKNAFRSTTDEIKRMAKEENLTLREVALRVATPKDPFFGSYEQVADRMIQWVDEKAADGFMLNLQVLGGQYDEFIHHVLPILEEKGYYNRTASVGTLRETLGLPFKENRYQAKPSEIY
ncbi:FMN-dependent oxidoreductase, nitrilotriacetate monooxygenase family [Bhargavaea ginsengi]|uniref:FMN-dependent oxidoreductase, nitrilotriacetate monooxygenase family n=1 Tax=Bhargavaea ginsengi TaxID=426757 RepID=A0A1H6Z2D1_9BACL|nr:LLM class flavin-dependent oxidoreductase [Bhargavaea ginsengi]SEJ43115.1 FMN-dependent oxidoreductase, nitrilotriacetate monooxygenase family [Bhargavaea ginsengi]